jgi:hypothetical protein
MAETIPGGAYQNPDGSWINAKGERIAAPKGEVYVRPEEEEVPLTPLTGEEFGAPPVPVSAPPKPRTSRAKKEE